MKSLLTVATSVLVFFAGGVNACPLMDAKQNTTNYDQDQTQQALVSNDIEIIDPELLAKLLLKKEKEIN